MAEEIKHQPLIIYPDRGKFLRISGAPFLLGGGLTFLAFVPWYHGVGSNVLALLARVLLLIWGWFYIPLLPWFLFPKPVVAITDEGISYSPPRIGPLAFRGELSWKQIKALYITEVTTHQLGRRGTQRVLCVLPKNVEAFLQPYTLRNKTVLTMFLTQFGSPFIIPETFISVTVEELLTHIRLYYADAISTYEIECQ